MEIACQPPSWSQYWYDSLWLCLNSHPILPTTNLLCVYGNWWFLVNDFDTYKSIFLHRLTTWFYVRDDLPCALGPFAMGCVKFLSITVPNSKVHGANMGPIWGRQDPGRPHVGPMNFAIWGGSVSHLCWPDDVIQNGYQDLRIWSEISLQLESVDKRKSILREFSFNSAPLDITIELLMASLLYGFVANRW